MHIIGIISTNKTDLPMDAIFPKRGRSKKERGAISCMLAEHGGQYYFHSSMDTKTVHL